METSPPVRDVAERHRANRNKCIVVAVTSVVILVAVVIIIAYITHFSSTELTPNSANSVIDKSLLRLKKDPVSLCSSTYEIILKENDTTLLERLGECTEAPQTNEDAEKLSEDLGNKNDTIRPNIICKLSAANVRIASEVNATGKITRDCKFNITIEVDFAFNEDNKVESIAFRGGRTGEITQGIVGTVRDALEESLLRVASEYSAANTTVDQVARDWSRICQRAPWGCA